jgi:predicted unusual protein kinase regulating ubiquinone biosynthesis (AarF/ABC1/UbiB family)
MTGTELMQKKFTGPYSGGPPADALLVRRPPLNRFGPAELLRILVVLVVLGGHLLVGMTRWAVGTLVARLRHQQAPDRDVALSNAAVDAFELLGPTYAKLGQLIASSPGLFPAALSNAARRCLDDMPAFPAALARNQVERQLGRPVAALFDEFCDTPLAAASIAQVHACVLPDGRAAVLKVRRPGIARRLVTDLRIMYRLAKVLDRRFELVRLTSMVGVVEQLYESNCQEINFALEASQQQRFSDAVGAFEDNKGVMVPEVYWDYCGPGVICMERLYGTPLDNPEQLAAQGVDGELPLRRGVKAWLEAAILHGPFHGDAHAGNLWLLDDGRLAYLDFGIVGELDEGWRQLLRDVLYTVMFDHNFERVARSLRRCGVLDPSVGTDAQLGWALSAMFGNVLNSPIHQLNSHQIIDMMITTARRYSGENPPELTLFAKQLLYFERYSAAIAPHWVVGTDPFLLRNIFPVEAAARAAELGVPMPD